MYKVTVTVLIDFDKARYQLLEYGEKKGQRAQRKAWRGWELRNVWNCVLVLGMNMPVCLECDYRVTESFPSRCVCSDLLR